MKIAVIFPKDSEALFNRNSTRTFGGANVQMYLIARELGRHKKIETISYINPYDTIDFPEGRKFKLVMTFRENDSLFRKILTFHRRIEACKPGAILQRGLTIYSCLLAFYCWFRKIRFVFMFAHDIEAEGRYQSSRGKCHLFPMLLRCASLLVVQNEIEYGLLRRRTNKRNVEIVKKGLPLSPGSPKTVKAYDAVWVARCEQWKNPEVFIRLAAVNPGRKFMMICSKVTGREEYFRGVKESAERLPNMVFNEFVKNTEIYALLSKSRIFVITSDQEGDWPMVVLEALSCGLPVLSLKLDYNGMLSEHGAGYYCGGDFGLLDGRLDELLTNPGLYRKMSRKSFEYVSTHHDIRKNVRTLLSLIMGRS